VAVLVIVACEATGPRASSKLERRGTYYDGRAEPIAPCYEVVGQEASPSENPFADNLPNPINDIDGNGMSITPRRSDADREALEKRLADADELWVLTPDAYATLAGDPSDELPDSGCLLTRFHDRIVPMPLEHTDVRGRIRGNLADVTVEQRFQNPYDTKIEARYIFPLPHSAAVHDFIMQIGERRIRGIVREREQAERIYEAARRAGHTASLLTQERPNIFTQAVANIEPGQRIDVEITYFDALPYRDGAFVFAFPMVVGPRFNPPGRGDGVGAVGRGAEGASRQRTEVSYLNPGERSGHDIALVLDIDAGLPIEALSSPSHAIRVTRDGTRCARVSLSESDTQPNRDFVLRIEVAGDDVRSGCVAHRDERGGYFALTIVPPKELTEIDREPMEFVFVLDCSGSMDGEPLDLAKAAVARCLRRLEADDTFQIIRFSERASGLGQQPIAATRENIRRGLDYLERLESGGGTHMIEGIRAALSFPVDPERRRLVSFLTDGFIGNETEILAEIARRCGDTRLFSFGVGSSVNRYLLEGMARLGDGAVAFVGLNESAAAQADLFYERIRHPALGHPTIDFGSLGVSGLTASRLPDLYVGRPITLYGRFDPKTIGDGETVTIRVEGRAGPRRFALSIPFASSREDKTAVVATLWARQQIERLSDRLAWEPSLETTTAIRNLALSYGLTSSFTAFLAVDSSRITEGNYGVVVPVAVPVPAGVKYETTVGGGG
ncbi:MAG: VWA domain-containing protein, partial [Planctomycetes bacterium]|nr:VWA domain-containing protein [Planctomycetota bacterium]